MRNYSFSLADVKVNFIPYEDPDLTIFFFVTDNKQLLDEVEHDIMNYQNRGLCYLPKPKAEADNTDLGFDNS